MGEAVVTTGDLLSESSMVEGRLELLELLRGPPGPTGEESPEVKAADNQRELKKMLSTNFNSSW